MHDVPRPCLECGDLTTDGSRCADCRREHERTTARATYEQHGRRDRLPGHDDAAWRRLSNRARKLQPWCSDCRRGVGDLEPHESLNLDHLPSAWWKKEHKKPILLTDTSVLCSTCNIKKGSSRPGTARYEAWLNENPENREPDETRHFKAQD